MSRRVGIFALVAVIVAMFALSAADALTSPGVNGAPAAEAMMARAKIDAGAASPRPMERSNGDRDRNAGGIAAKPQAVLMFDYAPVPDPATVALLASSVVLLVGNHYRRSSGRAW